MGLLPANFPTAGDVPEIKIYDNNNVLKYTWQHPIFGSTRDFKLYALELSIGYAPFLGTLKLNIHDNEKALVDLTDAKIPPKIKNEWIVDVYVGKDTAGKKRRFRGKIRQPNLIRDQKRQEFELFAVGHMTILDMWDVAIRYTQKRQADGITPDDTDNTAKVSEIAKDLLTNTKYYVTDGIGTPGFTVTGIDDIPVRLSDFIRPPGTKLLAALNELANSANAIWGLDYETMDVWMRKRGSKSSGFLLTNDLTSLQSSPWNVNKLCIFPKIKRKYADDSIDRMYSIYDCIGLYDQILDWNKTNANAAHNLSQYSFAFAVTPKQPNIKGVSIFMQRVGTPPDDMQISLLAADADTPNLNAILARAIVKKETLQAHSATGDYLDVLFFKEADVVPEKKYFVLVEKNGNVTNYMAVSYQTGTGQYYRSDSWTTSLVGEAKMRTWAKINITMPIIDLTSYNSAGPKHLPLTFPDVHYKTAQSMVQGLATSLSKPRRIFEPVTVTTPYDFLKPGQTAIYRDAYNNMETTVEIVQIDLAMNAYNLADYGATQMTLHVKEVT
jgi:hypothetical protein